MSNTRTYLQLLFFALFTGSTFHLAQYTTDSFSVSSAAAWRFGIAAVVMIVLLAVKEGIQIATLRENGKWFLLMGFFGIFMSNALFFWGLTYTSAINGSLIMATNPLVTSLLALFLLREPITPRQWAGIAVSLFGGLLVITQGSWHVLRDLDFSRGDLLLVLTNLSWALYGLIGRRFLKNVSSLATTSYTMVVGAVCLMLVSLCQPTPIPLGDVPVSAWGAILFMAVFTTVLGYLWWNQGIERVGVSKTSVFFNLVPVVTMILTASLGEPLTWVQGLGGLLVISGVLASTEGGRKTGKKANLRVE
jgi:drug/metabolite transporter (DMT)-like permease